MNSSNINTSRQQGAYTESLACRYLESKGLKLIEKNFSSRRGEIDLIMQDNNKNCLVFIEVRYRKNNNYGGALESITPSKQQKIINTASVYLQKNSKLAKQAMRFDVVAMTGTVDSENINNIDFNWIENAFDA